MRDEQRQLRTQVAAGQPEAQARMKALTEGMQDRARTINDDPELRARQGRWANASGRSKPAATVS